MDLTRPVTYRGFALNSATEAAGNPATGCAIDSVDYSDVDAVGYEEKRSMADGYDASDVFLGKRRVVLAGTLYGADRADLHDRLQNLRFAISPTSAYAESPGDFGYLPLNFDVPTKDLTNWPTGFISQMIRVRPARILQWSLNRDQVGGADMGNSLRWQALLDARDPRIYAFAEKDYTAWVGRTGTETPAPSFFNRGDYPGPLNILLQAPAGAAASVLTLNIAGTTMLLSMPTHASQVQVLRYDGTDKVVRLTIGAVTSLRMDLLSFPAGKTHPLITPGSNPFTYSRSGAAIGAGSHMWFWESWA